MKDVYKIDISDKTLDPTLIQALTVVIDVIEH